MHNVADLTRSEPFIGVGVGADHLACNAATGSIQFTATSTSWPRCWGAASQPSRAMAFLPHLAVRLGCVRPGLDTQSGCSDLQADLVCFVACCRTAREAVVRRATVETYFASRAR